MRSRLLPRCNANLIAPTLAGQRAYATAAARQEAWAKGITPGLATAAIMRAADVQAMLVQLLDHGTDEEP